MNKLNQPFRKAARTRTQARSPRNSRWSLPELLENRMMLSATTYVVNTTTDPTSVTPGTLSLRQAIQAVNADTSDSASSPDLIQFNLGSGGMQTIALTTPLPSLTSAVIIDGTSEPGYAGSPLVELNGAAATAGAGLEFDAGSDGSTVEGLMIDSFTGDGVVLHSTHDSVVNDVISNNSLDGVYVAGNNATIQGNLIGTDITGTQYDGNGWNASSFSAGVWVDGAAGTLIGGTSASQRNVISGGDQDGIAFTSATGTGNVVEGNYVGVDITGTNPLGNEDFGIDLGSYSGFAVANVSLLNNTVSANYIDGIYLSNASYNTIQGNLIGTESNGSEDPADSFGNYGDGLAIDNGSAGNLIGGTTSATRNVISGNQGNAISVSAGSITSANVIEGNYLGTDSTGTLANPNGTDGVDVISGITVIGGATPGSGNVISANYGFGISLSAGGTQVYGNLIGTNADGVTPQGNYGHGIYVNSNGNTIGSDMAGMGNVIANNGLDGDGAGVVVFAGVNNSIQGNSIYANSALGIDLGGDGVTPNNSNNHIGPNNFQNFPVITSVVQSGSTVTITGTLNAAASTQYNLDFFSDVADDLSMYGQGQVYVGSALVTTDASGNASFTIKLTEPAAAKSMTVWSATATDPLGNTSEFDQDVTQSEVVVPTQTATSTKLTSSANPSTFGQSVTFTATITGNSPTGTVTFIDQTTGVTLATVTLAPGSNVATYTTSGLAVETHQIVAQYGGDTNNLSSSGAVSQQVSRAASTTTLGASSTSITAGQSETLTATLSPTINGLKATGTVTFMDGTTTLGTVNISNGVATLSTTSLSVGSHSVVAIYNSDTNFAASQSNTVSITVKAAGSSISGTVYRDVTGNGLSSDDTTMSGVTVQLLQVQGTKTVVVASTTSTSNGSYSFINLASGSYEVQEVTPSGYVETAPTTSTYYSATVSSGTVITGDNFDNYMAGCANMGSITNVTYLIDGKKRVTNLRGATQQGDTVSATFTISKGYVDTLSLVSYIAPGATFVASQASQQTIYQDATGTFGPGTYTLTVVLPQCYYQVDFVCGDAINQFGPAGSNIFYSAEDRLISADNGGTCPPKSH